jgi:hypothetical protein
MDIFKWRISGNSYAIVESVFSTKRELSEYYDLRSIILFYYKIYINGNT